jgi:catechol 2,3-dioxygenase-like lactoylglutathione lyase family enzyme
MAIDEPEPLFRKVDCLALPVPELETAVAFYGMLGHKVIWRTGGAVGLSLPDGEAELVLQTERPGPETDLMADSVHAAVVAFVSAGGRLVVEEFDIPIGRCAVVADPWDNQLVLLDNSKGKYTTDADGWVTGVDTEPS